MIITLLISCNERNELPVRVEHSPNQEFCRKIIFAKNVENKLIEVAAWRELQINYRHANIYIEPVKNGQIYKNLKLLYFNNHRNLTIEKIHYTMQDDDYKWIDNYDKENEKKPNKGSQ